MTFIAVLVSCSNQTQAPTGERANSGGGACGSPDTTIPLPSDFPTILPLPPGTVFTSREDRSGGRIILNGTVPSNLPATIAFFEQEFPKAGFTLRDRDGEEDEEEATYEGNRYVGRWKVRTIPGCQNAVTLTILAQRR
jgi:hypothetical protein